MGKGKGKGAKKPSSGGGVTAHRRAGRKPGKRGLPMVSSSAGKSSQLVTAGWREVASISASAGAAGGGGGGGGGAAAGAGGGGAPLGGPSLARRFAVLTQNNPNPRSAGLYRSHHSILLVGEGDFTFSLALATALGGARVTATSLDTRRQVEAKYATADGVLSALEAAGARVKHGIDCTMMHAPSPDGCRDFLLSIQPTGFDRIVFNFPHVGGSTTEDVEFNQEVLYRFMISARAVLAPPSPVMVEKFKAKAKAKARAKANARARAKAKAETGQVPHADAGSDSYSESETDSDSDSEADVASMGGQVHVTLRSTPFYDSWKLEDIGEETGMKLVQKVRFRPGQFAGYKPVRTHPAARDAPDPETKAYTYVFARRPGKRAPPMPPPRPSEDYDARPSHGPSVPATAQPANPLRATSASKRPASLQPAAAEEPAMDDAPINSCAVCGESYDNERQYNIHLRSPWHQRNVEKDEKRKKNEKAQRQAAEAEAKAEAEADAAAARRNKSSVPEGGWTGVGNYMKRPETPGLRGRGSGLRGRKSGRTDRGGTTRIGGGSGRKRERDHSVGAGGAGRPGARRGRGGSSGPSPGAAPRGRAGPSKRGRTGRR